MDARQVTCSTCGADLPIACSTGADRRPCEHCGGTPITVSLHGGATAGASASTSKVVQTTNAAGSKRRRLQAKLGDLEGAGVAELARRLPRRLEARALGSLRSATQQNAYTSRLHGHGVLPFLRLLVARVAASVP
jgi:hypothetical protein